VLAFVVDDFSGQFLRTAAEGRGRHVAGDRAVVRVQLPICGPNGLMFVQWVG
jgi:hypothetical protein